MPPYIKHLEISDKRTGKNYQPLHDWLDNYPDEKASRHDLYRLAENREFVMENWGKEGVTEFFYHVAEDFLMKELEILKQAGCDEDDIRHSLEVARKSLEIVSRVKIEVDRDLLARGAVLHDLGKAETHGIEHGEIGAKMAEALGLQEEIRQIILKHIRGGMTEAEARDLNLPVRDYSLTTPEEKIIIYADRMVDMYTEKIIPDIDEKKAEERFIEILENFEKYGKNPITRERYQGIHQEIQEWVN